MKIKGNRTFYVVMILAAFFVPPLLVTNFGIQLHTVTTGSMRPGIKPGAVIVTNTVPMGSLKTHEVIIYFENQIKQVVSHRIVSIVDKGTKLSIVTKGDANALPDPSILVDKTIKVDKVVAVIPNAGFFVAALHSTAGRFATLLVLLLMPVSLFLEKRYARKKKNIQGEEPSKELLPVFSTTPTHNLEGTKNNEDN